MKLNPDCATRHLGMWLIEPLWMQSAVAAIKAGAWTAQESRSEYTQRTADGIGVVHMSGQMMKGESKFGGINTVAVRNDVRAMIADESVKGVILSIDSPGGTVSGTDDLATDVRLLANAKPVYVQINDLGASAAYWVAAAATKIFATRSSEVGSIGIVAVLEDTSKAFDMAGITVKVVSTGGMKGTLTDGKPITDEEVAYFQQRVNNIGELFFDSVALGRGFMRSEMADITNGKVWIASDALDLGLIDGIQSFDDTYRQMLQDTKSKKSVNSGQRLRQARINIAKRI